MILYGVPGGGESRPTRLPARAGGAARLHAGRRGPQRPAGLRRREPAPPGPGPARRRAHAHGVGGDRDAPGRPVSRAGAWRRRSGTAERSDWYRLARLPHQHHRDRTSTSGSTWSATPTRPPCEPGVRGAATARLTAGLRLAGAGARPAVVPGRGPLRRRRRIPVDALPLEPAPRTAGVHTANLGRYWDALAERPRCGRRSRWRASRRWPHTISRAARRGPQDARGARWAATARLPAGSARPPG